MIIDYGRRVAMLGLDLSSSPNWGPPVIYGLLVLYKYSVPPIVAVMLSDAMWMQMLESTVNMDLSELEAASVNGAIDRIKSCLFRTASDNHRLWRLDRVESSTHTFDETGWTFRKLIFTLSLALVRHSGRRFSPPNQGFYNDFHWSGRAYRPI